MPIVIPPDAARRFRAVVRKCRPPRSRDPAPLVFVRAKGGTLTLFAGAGAVAVALSVPAETGAGTAVTDMAELERADSLGLPARLDAPPPEARPACRVPSLPADPAAVPPTLLGALHEAGRTAARDPGKYAVTRVLVRGGAGQVVGTDGRQLLIQGGYEFPFADDVLVPAVPIFGSKELATPEEVRVGKTDTHLVLTAGPWTVWLAVDAGGRFPDVDGVIPRRPGATLDIDDPAAAAALVRLLPVADGDDALTVDLGDRLTFRVRGTTDGPPHEAIVPGATVSGPPVSVAVVRRLFVRALDLGLRSFRFPGADRPWVASDAARTYLAVSLGPAGIVPPADRDAARPPRSDPLPHPPPAETPMPAPNGSPATGHAGTEPAPDPPDVMHAAETLKADLADAHASAARLVAALKAQRRQRRTVETALASLRSLRLE